jgi:murein DD-endopeptidase MepM/ murein hydrolase activator NlpD
MPAAVATLAVLFAVVATVAGAVAAESAGATPPARPNAAPAAAPAAHPSLQQLVEQAAAVKVRLNLAIAQDSAVKTELIRLQGLVATEEAIVTADRSAEAAADARVADASARLTALDSQSHAARQALVDRAIDLYEHPYLDAELLLWGTVSLQVLADAVQARTSDLVDAVRHDLIEERVAAADLADARQEAQTRHAAATAQYQLLQTALASEQQVHDALEVRIHDDDSQLSALQPQIAQLIAARNAQYRAQIVAAAALLPDTSPVLGPVGSYGLEWPIAGIVTQEFGHNGHPGIDIAAPYGTPINAAGTGVVIYAGWEQGYGNYTCISHGGGISTCYGHQSAIYVTVGQTVTRAQVIGAEGSTGNSTGPHVHFEVRVNGQVRNPRLFIPGNP